MSGSADQELVYEIIDSNRYLSLATTDGLEPWVAPLEYITDEELKFYFLSTNDARHIRHIEQNPTVAAAIFDSTQPEYSGDLSANLRGVQLRGVVRRLAADEYPASVVAGIEALQPPMPPYCVFALIPSNFYLPKITQGVNERVEVAMPGHSSREV